MATQNGDIECGERASSQIYCQSGTGDDNEQSIQSEAESEEKTPNTNRRDKIEPHDSSEMQQPTSVSNHYLYSVTSDRDRNNWCMLLQVTGVSGLFLENMTTDFTI